MTVNQSPPTLDYHTPTTSGSDITRQRVLYCIALPLMCFGFCVALGAGDRLMGSIIMASGGFLLGMALPIRR